MKNILTLILCVFVHITMFARTDQDKRAMFQFSFATPMGTNGLYSAKYTNRISLNLLVGVSQNEEAFALGGISNVILNNANGFYLAGISNHIGNESQGFQLAGIVNTNKNKFNGFQFAGVINTSSEFCGLQLSGIINVAKDVHGFQFSGLINKANKVRGIQLAGLVNIATDSECPTGLINIIKNGEKSVAVLNNANGFCLAGISNHIGNESQGFQLAGIVNTNENKFNGFQFAGVINTSSELYGLQLSGLINIAKDVHGFQFSGLVNKANKVRGIQLAGLVNIATDSDYPIGLINIIKNGEKSIAVTYNAVGNTILSFRSGGKYTYGILGVGFNHRIKGKSIVAEGGLGVHIPITSWFRINNEIKLSSIGCNSPSKSAVNWGYSLFPGIKLGKSFELFVGGGINYMESNDTNNGWILPKHSLWKKQGNIQLQQLYLGYEIGMQYIF